MQKALHRPAEAQAISERRTAHRTEVEVPVAYSFLKTFSSRTFDAMARNCSDNGLCMDTLYKMSPGQMVCIRKKRTPRTASLGKKGHLLKPFKVAEVRWCRERPGGIQRRYGVGLRYC